MNLLPKQYRRARIFRSVWFFVCFLALLSAGLAAYLLVLSHMHTTYETRLADSTAVLLDFDPRYARTAAELAQALALADAFAADMAAAGGQVHDISWLHEVIAATPADSTLVRLYFRDGTLTITAHAENLPAIDTHIFALAYMGWEALPGRITRVVYNYETTYEYEITATQ
jgi:hypothetical protein